jgi:hypothetical protein
LTIRRQVPWIFPGISKVPRFEDRVPFWVIRKGSFVDFLIAYLLPRKIGYYRHVRIGSQIHGRFHLTKKRDEFIKAQIEGRNK